MDSLGRPPEPVRFPMVTRLNIHAENRDYRCHELNLENSMFLKTIEPLLLTGRGGSVASMGPIINDGGMSTLNGSGGNSGVGAERGMSGGAGRSDRCRIRCPSHIRVGSSQLRRACEHGRVSYAASVRSFHEPAWSPLPRPPH